MIHLQKALQAALIFQILVAKGVHAPVAAFARDGAATGAGGEVELPEALWSEFEANFPDYIRKAQDHAKRGVDRVHHRPRLERRS